MLDRKKEREGEKQKKNPQREKSENIPRTKYAVPLILQGLKSILI